MILDTLKNAPGYAALNPHFAKAIDFMSRNNLAELPLGKHPIDGDNVWATVTEGALKSPEEARVETHDKYIDIQICLKGMETFGWIARETCTQPVGEYNVEKDILFWKDRATAFVTVNEGEFVCFFPEDAHLPMIGEGSIRKCVIKIKA